MHYRGLSEMASQYAEYCVYAYIYNTAQHLNQCVKVLHTAQLWQYRIL